MSAQHTPGPWFVGAQNDALFVIAGRPPALNNDAPWHDAPRVVLARVFGPTGDDCLPVNAEANANLFSASDELLWFAQQIFNGIDTEMLKLDTPADEILARVLQRGRAAIAKAEGRL